MDIFLGALTHYIQKEPVKMRRAEAHMRSQLAQAKSSSMVRLDQMDDRDDSLIVQYGWREMPLHGHAEREVFS